LKFYNKCEKTPIEVRQKRIGILEFFHCNLQVNLKPRHKIIIIKRDKIIAVNCSLSHNFQNYVRIIKSEHFGSSSTRDMRRETSTKSTSYNNRMRVFCTETTGNALNDARFTAENYV
jgi:hypothetical protein